LHIQQLIARLAFDDDIVGIVGRNREPAQRIHVEQGRPFAYHHTHAVPGPARAIEFHL